MASISNVILGSVAALLIWTCIGLAVARAVLPQRALWWPVAPALGWAVHSAAMLPLFTLIGFNRITVTIVTALAVAAAVYALRRQPRAEPDKDSLRIPVWAWIGALVIALVPASAILPKFVDGAVVLSGPIFDHVKVAMIDEMARLGLPPGNPFFGEEGQPSRLVYYYLLHFSAAELSLLLGISGWEADAALTWFSAFASLMLMIGLAVWMSGRKLAALLVLLVCMSGSLRPLLGLIPNIDSVVKHQTGFAGWLFQSAWVPQHIAATSCVVLAILLLSELVRRESFTLLATFVLVVAAGAGSSTWVGGVTFAVAAIWIGGVTLSNAEPQQRMPLLGRFALAAIGALVLAAPVLYPQFAAMGTRGGGSPVALQTYEVLGEFFAPALRQFLDMPAFWVILLVVELPAIYFTGVYAMLRLTPTLDPDRKRIATILIHLAGASLAVSWLMVSTIGGNNDLGWRAVLPACIVLTVFAVAGLALWIKTRSRLAIAGFVMIALGLPSGIDTLRYDVFGTPNPAGAAFAATPEMWAAVRRHAGPAARVANNPAFMETMTPWPVNISWALLSNRRSCFAGHELSLPFIPLPRPQLRAIDAQFTRVFSGEGWPEDMRDLTTRYGCKVAVVTALDGAWTRDPFATSEHWRLVEQSPNGWRIYVAGAMATASR